MHACACSGISFQTPGRVTGCTLLFLNVSSWCVRQVHEEVLRLLLAALGKLGTALVADYLQTLLRNSRKSRR
jgi:hypothetical protein